MEHRTPRIPYHREILLFTGRVRRALKPQMVLLYGSLARGDFHQGSDVDIIVVSDHIPHDLVDRWKLIDSITPATLPAEVLAYTTREFEAMIEQRHPTALSAMEEGRVLHDNGFYQAARREHKQVQKRTGLKKTERGWVAEKLLPVGLRR